MKTCDADECYADISGCSDGCNNTIGSYQCTCPPEKFLSSDGHNCGLFKTIMLTIVHESSITLIYTFKKLTCFFL